MDRSSALSFGRDVVAVSRERQLSVTSAGLAYHVFNTLVPFVILLLVAVTLVDSLEVALESLEADIGLEATGALETLEGVTGDGAGDRLRAAAIALVVFLWSTVRMFQATNSAFTGVYGSRKHQSFLEGIVNTSLITATVVVAVTLVGIVGVALSIVVDGTWFALVSPLVLFGLLVVAFFPTYYLFPEADVSAREVLPGTVFAAVTWTILAVGFRFYVVTADSVALFGIAGAVLLLLTWVYLGALCVLVGVVGNAVLAGRVDVDGEWVPMEELWSRYV
ncbi:YihY/virulence factor BrkB family protein [Natronosalvus vescus]|uniref:YihY/virulence factor BrkB family protein n=1 Tax=Natronosalvus vescus TaxID=2953881 RepID=UPI0020905C72|nr:YihY/virulence factor BrkB family protein [Natronosalvus vescus]